MDANRWFHVRQNRSKKQAEHAAVPFIRSWHRWDAHTLAGRYGSGHILARGESLGPPESVVIRPALVLVLANVSGCLPLAEYPDQHAEEHLVPGKTAPVQDLPSAPLLACLPSLPACVNFALLRSLARALACLPHAEGLAYQ